MEEVNLLTSEPTLLRSAHWDWVHQDLSLSAKPKPGTYDEGKEKMVKVIHHWVTCAFIPYFHRKMFFSLLSYALEFYSNHLKIYFYDNKRRE